MRFDEWVDRYFADQSIEPTRLKHAFQHSDEAVSRRIVYAISANPPTWGHADLMMRAASHFDHLYWVAAKNTNKTMTFSDAERMMMMQRYVDYYKLNNVTVDVFAGTIVRYAHEHGAQFLMRGLRNSSDFQAELEMAAGNRGINKNIETICMFTKPHFATISSTIVRELAGLDENINQYVLPSLVPLIKKKISVTF